MISQTESNQLSPVPYATRLFKHIAPPESSAWAFSWSSDEVTPRKPIRSLRLRIGRGGRRMLVRRDLAPTPIQAPENQLFL